MDLIKKTLYKERKTFWKSLFRKYEKNDESADVSDYIANSSNRISELFAVAYTQSNKIPPKVLTFYEEQPSEPECDENKFKEEPQECLPEPAEESVIIGNDQSDTASEESRNKSKNVKTSDYSSDNTQEISAERPTPVLDKAKATDSSNSDTTRIKRRTIRRKNVKNSTKLDNNLSDSNTPSSSEISTEMHISGEVSTADQSTTATATRANKLTDCRKSVKKSSANEMEPYNHDEVDPSTHQQVQLESITPLKLAERPKTTKPVFVEHILPDDDELIVAKNLETNKLNKTLKKVFENVLVKQEETCNEISSFSSDESQLNQSSFIEDSLSSESNISTYQQPHRRFVRRIKRSEQKRFESMPKRIRISWNDSSACY